MMDVAGLFYGIGHKPNTELIAHRVTLDPKGYVKVEHEVSTNVPGLFAAGDLVWGGEGGICVCVCVNGVGSARGLDQRPGAVCSRRPGMGRGGGYMCV